MRSYLREADLDALKTCLECSGSGAVPSIFGDYGPCMGCAVLPRDPFLRADGDSEAEEP